MPIPDFENNGVRIVSDYVHSGYKGKLLTVFGRDEPLIWCVPGAGQVRTSRIEGDPGLDLVRCPYMGSYGVLHRVESGV